VLRSLAGAEGFEPPSSVLETDSLTVELTPLLPLSFHFFVRRMLPAALAEFLQFQPVRSRLPILGARIVPLFAITALHRNNFSGHCSLPVFPNRSRAFPTRLDGRDGRPPLIISSYCTISLMVPAPTVCPPSRIAKRKPFSIATGVINSITRLTLSPGITISVAAGNSATPVTSVVRK
jgi:hypothetical protein